MIVLAVELLLEIPLADKSLNDLHPIRDSGNFIASLAA
jgi:hypothetical protein